MFRYILIFFLSFLLIFGFLEIGFRAFLTVRNAVGEKTFSYGLRLSESLGWETIPQDRSERDFPGYGPVKYSTQEYGFRAFGNLRTDRRKIFIIGDSFTQAFTVSDGNAYYDELKRRLKDVEVFAYGGGGYGSLQEYMILDKYIDMINPDMVLWQFCGNDLINNDYDLERQSYRNNNLKRRPYLINNEVKFLFPRPGDGVMDSLVSWSRLLKFFKIHQNLWLAKQKDSVEDILDGNHPLFKRSLETTQAILGMAQKRSQPARLIVFFSENSEWNRIVCEKICAQLNIPCLWEAAKAVDQARADGVRVDGAPYDTHWNRQGHKAAGEALAEYLHSIK